MASTVTPDSAMKTQQDMANASRAEIEGYLKSQHEANMARQQAELGMARDKQIEGLKASYEKAVADGELSVRDAEEMFVKQKGEIDKQAYLDVQASALNAQSLGIQNSMQYGALQNDDAMRRATLTNNASSDRNSRISSVRERLKALSADTDRAIVGANSDHDYQLAMGKASLEGAFSGQMAELRAQEAERLSNQRFQMDMGAIQQAYTRSNMWKQHEYASKQAQQQQKYTLAQMAQAYGYDIKKMDHNQKLELAKMAKAQGYELQILDKQIQADLEKMDKQQAYTLEQFAVQHGYDLSKMDAQQQYALAQMAEQQGYDLEMEGVRHGYNVSMSELELENATKLKQQEIQAQIQAEERAYDNAVKRELAKYTKGSSEYKIREKQLADEKRALQTEWSAKLEFDMISEEILNGQTTKPTKPKKKWYELESTYKKRVADYEAKLKSYERYMEFKKDPSKAFGGKGNASGLGSLSSKYESNGNPGAIGRNKGDTGGASYGSYQLTTNSGNAQAFANSYGGLLKGKKAGTQAFDNAWKAEAKKNPAKFKQAQHDYIANTHYKPTLRELNKALGFNLGALPKAIQDVIWSVGVQHGSGGAVNVFRTAGVRKGDSPKTIIEKVYAVRGNFFTRSSKEIQASVRRRFAQEKKDALRMLG